MFGSNNNSFTFGQPQQQQPAQQTGGLFGGSTFGAQPSAFGQAQQPAQTGFGGFGAAPAATNAFGAPQASTSTFGSAPASGGLFGQQAQQQPAQNSTFSFGGGGNTFGQPAANTGGGLFGASKPATTGFGGFGAPPSTPQQTGGGLFGGGASTPAFGAPAAQPGSGTAVAAYTPTQVMEPQAEEGKPPPANQTAHNYQSISCMPQYKNFSVEELRVQDYQANRKTPQAGASTSSFGGFGQQQPAQTGFGAQPSGSIFGAASSTPAFGAAAPTNNAFGAPASTGGGLFGSTPAASTPFGQPAQTAGAFGQPAQPATGGLFGGASTGFGQPAAQPAANSFGGFGAAAPKPATTGFSFGAAAPTSAPAAGGGLFGAAATPASNPFGQPAASAPAAGGGLFGQTQPAAPAAGGFSFGGASAAPAAKPLFGSTPATSSPFGASAATAAKPAFSFGAPAAPAAGGGLFGSAAPAAPSAFGAAPAAGGFGQPATSTFGAPAAAPASTGFGGGLFGAKPATSAPAMGGLFGSAPAAGALGGGSLFGASQPAPTAQPSGGLFGGSLGSTFGGGLNNSAQQQQQQQQQQPQYASAEDPNAYGSNPLFASTAPAAPGANAAEKKKAPIFTAFRGTPINRSSTKITRLRGFGASTNSPAQGSPLSLSLGPNSPGANRGSPLRLVNGLGDDTLSPSAFVTRPSVKKLVISKDAPQFGFAKNAAGASPDKSIGGTPAALKAKASFNPDLEIPSSINRSMIQSTSHLADESTFSIGTPFKKALGASEPADLAASTNEVDSQWPPKRAPVQPRKPVHGEYYTIPAIEVLEKLPPSKLRKVSDLTVGRVGFGQVSFQAPVDLTTLSSVDDLLGSIVLFEDRNCSVYPPQYEDIKPPSGEGLNVPAVIELERCWPVDKATRQPIKEEGHPRLNQHVKRLKALDETEFIEFDPKEGKWTFRVEAF